MTELSLQDIFTTSTGTCGRLKGKPKDVLKTSSRHLLSHFFMSSRRRQRPKVKVSRKTYFNWIEERKSGKFETVSLAKDYYKLM